jgi:hypothetical protein
MTILAPLPKFQFFDANGDPLVGGKLWTYAAGTTTPLATYTNSGGGTANTNPVILDSRGEASVWMSSSAAYKFKLTTATNVDVWTVDNIAGPADALSLAASGGSSLIGFLQAGSGAVARTLQSKGRETISVTDFGASTGASASANVTAFGLALAAAAGKALYVPGGGTYNINDTLTVPDDTQVYGDGYGSCIKQTAREKNVLALGNRCEIEGLRIQGDGVTTGGVDFEKNNGVFIDNKQNSRILFCWIHGFEYNGIFCQNTTGLTIQGNVIYGNANSRNEASDIVLYSDSGSIRTNITGNFLLSNNSQGCWVNALGLDTDISITNNFACPVDANGVVVTGASIARRHGFMLGYVGGTDYGGRITCSNNLSLNTRQTGVYWQSATTSGGSVTISHNYIRGAGTNAATPSLAGGIFIAAQGPADVVMGNIIEDMPTTGFITAAGINVQPQAASPPAGNNTLIQGNSISNTAGHGIYVGSKAQNVKVIDNTVNGHTQAAYIYVGGGGFTGGGTMEFSGNRSYAPAAAVNGIYISRQTATPLFIVRDNLLNGYDNTTAAATNAGLLIADWDQPHRVEGNTFVNFYAGVSSAAYCNAYATVPRFLNNLFNTCNAAYHVSSVAGAGRLVTEGDVLVSTSNLQAVSLLAGSRVVYSGIKLSNSAWQIWLNATPAAGTWAVGDRIQQSVSAAGQPKGWQCTVAGSPGGWTGEGNL